MPRIPGTQRNGVRKMDLVITPENNLYLRLRDEWIREGLERGRKEDLENLKMNLRASA